jgi:hypothetical protein
MPKKRVKVPREIADKVLKEYRHKCAMCGRPEPQLHHLDEDPANNDPLNLLPLCPNCHLQDTHDPTSPPDPDKLRLFRKYKDPLILDPRFHPLFRRFTELRDQNPDGLRSAASTLAEFVREFQMGGFYGREISQLASAFEIYDADSEFAPMVAADADTAARTKDEIELLIVELLRYQNWKLDKPAS